MTSRLAGAVVAAMILGSAAAVVCDEIRLPNRSVDSSQGIDKKLRAKLSSPAQTKLVQAVVQLHHLSSKLDRASLDTAGVRLGTFVGGTAFLARVRPGTNLDAISLVRWAGSVLPQDKISEELWGIAHPPPPPTTGPAQLMIAVAFEEDVTPATASSIILKIFPIVQTYGSLSTYALRIPRDALEPLAMNLSVRWVEAIQPDYFPLPP